MRTTMRLTCVLAPAVLWTASLWAAQPRTLFEFNEAFDTSAVRTSDATVTAVDGGLVIRTGHTETWPGVTLRAPDGKWDLSDCQYVRVTLQNTSTKEVKVFCRVDNSGANGTDHCVTASMAIRPGQPTRLTVNLHPVPWRLSEPPENELVGMRAAPTHQGNIDPANVTQLLLFVHQPEADHTFTVSKVTAGGRVVELNTKTFFPFIDEFGQFIHDDWGGKTLSVEDMRKQIEIENADLVAHPGPEDRNEYGGWTRGPKLDATGFFRVTKHGGTWWLVDPAGRLFWSHGVDCVWPRTVTPISDREHYYRNLPGDDSVFSQFYGSGNWAPHGYYKEKGSYRTYDFGQANLVRKYQTNALGKFAVITHRRLKSWGLNTIANWSDANIYRMRRTPYVATIHFDSRTLEGSEGYWGKFYDVFDPSFREAIRKRVAAEKDRSAGDPMCIGYFVNNELSWGDEVSLAEAALTSPADQPAKRMFIEDLKAKHKTIDRLNAAWGTDHGDWDDLIASQTPPDRKRARDDLTAFYTKTAETYFKTIADEVKAVAPNQLYMGCRFAWVNDRAVRAAAEYCDIISFNRYAYSVADLTLPDGIDLPVIIGEFHFGALDRGMFHTGLRATDNQQDRAAKYISYVEGALRNPYIVGTHWFQYRDQATTGRGDGENYQIGLIDVCDRPYPEIVAACRQIGDTMYSLRLGE